MPEQRLARTRLTLPAGYQFGDAAPDIDAELWAQLNTKPLAFLPILTDCGVPASSPRAVGAGQTGSTITVTASTITWRRPSDNAGDVLRRRAEADIHAGEQ